jgi:Na+/H+-dicarboxylate symporter
MKGRRKKLKISLASRIIIGVVLGIIVGLFFGEKVDPITILGEVFIMLLQMRVFPYVFLSLIVGIGSFNIMEPRWSVNRNVLHWVD